MHGNVLGSTPAVFFFRVAINFFYNILNYLIARSVGDELQFSIPSGNSNFIIVITPPWKIVHLGLQIVLWKLKKVVRSKVRRINYFMLRIIFWLLISSQMLMQKKYYELGTWNLALFFRISKNFSVLIRLCALLFQK